MRDDETGQKKNDDDRKRIITTIYITEMIYPIFRKLPGKPQDKKIITIIITFIYTYKAG